jgi:hypothetical protein
MNNFNFKNGLRYFFLIVPKIAIIIVIVILCTSVASGFVLRAAPCRRQSYPKSPESSTTTTATTTTCRTTIQHHGQAAVAAAEISERDPKLALLSQDPIILLSTTPVLTSEECNFLLQNFESGRITTTHNNNNSDNPNTDSMVAELNKLVSKITNCPHHPGETECPRYISYHDFTSLTTTASTQEYIASSSSSSSSSCSLSPSVLLPDGLHIDINNGKLFRHITALLYLTDHDDYLGGATTFPFAIPRTTVL